MTATIPNNNKAIELLNDILSINNERINGYQKVLDQSASISTDLREEILKIISDGLTYREQLIEKIGALNNETAVGTSVRGKIFRAWADLKVAFALKTQKAIISSCRYNEEIVMHTYNAALIQDVEMSVDVRQLLEDQKMNLRRIHNRLRKYIETRFVEEQSLVYFN